MQDISGEQVIIFMKVQGHKMYNTQFFLLKNVMAFHGREKTLIFLSRQYLGKFQAFYIRIAIS